MSVTRPRRPGALVPDAALLVTLFAALSCAAPAWGQYGPPRASGTSPPQRAGESTAGTPEMRSFDIAAGEYRFDPAEITSGPGQPLLIALHNRGAERHSIEFELPGREIEFPSPLTAGQTGLLSFTAPTAPGRYTFYCPVGDHRQRGMTGVLIIRSEPPESRAARTEVPMPAPAELNTYRGYGLTDREIAAAIVIARSTGQGVQPIVRRIQRGEHPDVVASEYNLPAGEVREAAAEIAAGFPARGRAGRSPRAARVAGERIILRAGETEAAPTTTVPLPDPETVRSLQAAGLSNREIAAAAILGAATGQSTTHLARRMIFGEHPRVIASDYNLDGGLVWRDAAILARRLPAR